MQSSLPAMPSVNEAAHADGAVGGGDGHRKAPSAENSPTEKDVGRVEAEHGGRPTARGDIRFAGRRAGDSDAAADSAGGVPLFAARSRCRGAEHVEAPAGG